MEDFLPADSAPFNLRISTFDFYLVIYLFIYLYLQLGASFDVETLSSV